MIKELEWIRGFAAFYVFFGHLLQIFELNKYYIVNFLFCSFGQEAVMVFFILSGFVISLSWSKQKVRKTHFIKKRFFRIYPLMMFSLVLSFIYVIISGKNLELDILLANIFNLQDFDAEKPNIFFKTYYNSALWSLSYEWWFYMVFILIANYKNRNTVSRLIIIISSITYLFFPNQVSRWLMYFGIWYCGFLIFELYNQKKISSIKNLSPILIYIIFPLFITLLNLIIYKNIGPGLFPVLEFRHFASSLLFILLGFYLYKNKMIFFFVTSKFRIFEKIAPFSYGLYILHLPITNIVKFIFKNNNIELAFVLTFFLSIIISFIAEIKIQNRITNYMKKYKVI